MMEVMEFIILAARRSCVVHDSHVLYHGISSVESCFWDSSVIIFPICLRKGLISSSPRIRGVDFTFRRDFDIVGVRGGVVRRSCDGGFDESVGVVVGEFAIFGRFSCLRGNARGRLGYLMYYFQIAYVRCVYGSCGTGIPIVLDQVTVYCFTCGSKGVLLTELFIRSVVHLALKSVGHNLV